jgi:hypothetical protein
MEGKMRRYALVSGVFFTLFTAGQLIRFLLQWPVIIAGFAVPTWWSLVAAIIVGSLAVWAFRVRSRVV